MATDKGYPSKDRELGRDIEQDHITAGPVREKQYAKDVTAHNFVREVSTDAVEASSTTTIINATAHLAKTGDIIQFTSGNLSGQEVRVLKTETDSIELCEILSEAPATSDSFKILRFKHPLVDSNGSIQATTTSGPLIFTLDGADQEVVEDTVTPANNRPLPVKLTGVTGDITITADNLDVQLEHNGANPDSVQIGDGTETLQINASGEAQVRDDSANTTLSSIDSKDFATQTTLAALLTELQAKADLVETQPVSAASLPLPTGAATEATLASIDSKDFATQTTLAALLTELQLKADLSETQPVSAASLPLPTGAATEATLASLDAKDFATQTTLSAVLTELQLKADLTETQPVSAASLPLPTGAATEATLALIEGKDFATQTTLAALLTELQLKADLSETQPVSAASLPLPTGAATESTLSAISAQLPATLGQKTKAASLAVTLASDEDTLAVEETVKDVTEFVRNDYTSTSVTTGAYVQLIASTTATIKKMQIFDSSGQTLVIATGAAAAEVDKFYVFPGGNGDIDVSIPAGTRISIKAVSATADAGEISINLIG